MGMLFEVFKEWLLLTAMYRAKIMRWRVEEGWVTVLGLRRRLRYD